MKPKDYMYTISGTFEFEVYATDEDEAEEIVNNKLRLQNVDYKIWRGE